MASIYEKPPHILQAKLWDEKTSLSETYKLQSNDTCNNIKAKVHQDSGQLGIEFTVDKTSTREPRRFTSTGLTHSLSLRTAYWDSTKLPGSRSYMSSTQNQ